MSPKSIVDGFMGLDTAHKRYLARRKALGLCATHACPNQRVNKTHCDPCRIRMNARMKEWMRKKKGIGEGPESSIGD